MLGLSANALAPYSGPMQVTRCRAWIGLTAVAVGTSGCAALQPPAAARVPQSHAATRAEADAVVTRRQVDPDGPVATCDNKGRPISEWPDTLLPASIAIQR